MNLVRKNSARFGGPAAALLLLAGVPAGCQSAPPDSTDEPPIADAEPAPATLIAQPAVLRSSAEKPPRLLNAAVEVHDLHAPAVQALPPVIPHPRGPAIVRPEKTDETTPTGATPTPEKKTAMISPERPFEWPVEGKIVSTFGSGGDGARN